MPASVRVAPHALLALDLFQTEWPIALGELSTPAWLEALLDGRAAVPLPERDPELATAIRRMLRLHGFKASGRNKPASEYLAQAARGPGVRTINPAVDTCNAVSLHSGLPISVIDLDLSPEPHRIAPAPPGSLYPFNPSGQVLELTGLICLSDADGPCANPVKDSQRTKTHTATLRTLSVVWGTHTHLETLQAASGWYRELLVRQGAEIRAVEVQAAPDETT